MIENPLLRIVSQNEECDFPNKFITPSGPVLFLILISLSHDNIEQFMAHLWRIKTTGGVSNFLLWVRVFSAFLQFPFISTIVNFSYPTALNQFPLAKDQWKVLSSSLPLRSYRPPLVPKHRENKAANIS